MRCGRRVAVLTLAAALLGAAPAARAAGPTVLWGSYGGDDQLTNHVGRGKLTPATARSLAQTWRQKVDGPVLASPLLAQDVLVDGAPRTLLYVSSEAGSVYALDSSTGLVVWKRELGAFEADANCGTLGISATGAIDGGRGLLYVVNADGALYALDLATGDSPDGWPLQLLDRPRTEYVWGGLRIAADRLLVPVASYCDQPDEHGDPAEGGVLGVDLATRTVVTRFDSVPGPANLGGVWGWGGTSVEPDGSAIYTAIGNSDVQDPGCDCKVDDAGFGDSVVRLTADLEPIDSNRPPDVPTVHDYDFGAAPLLFQPAGCEPLAAANNKDGELYVWRRLDLAAGPIFAAPIGTTSGAPFVGQPSWSPDRGLLLDAGTQVAPNGVAIGDGITAFSVDAACEFHDVWQTATGSGTQPPPVIVGDVVFAAGGAGTFFTALALANGNGLWRFDTGTATQTPPIATGDAVYTADGDGVVRAFAPVPAKPKPKPKPRASSGSRWVRTA